MQFNEIMLFDFEELLFMVDGNNNIKFDEKLLKKMNQPLVLELIHQKGTQL